MRGAVGLLLVILVAVCVSASSASTTPLPRVTVIGDSVLTGVLWNAGPLAALERGFDMHLDIGVCRTITGVSCTYEGGHVSTLDEAVGGLGAELAPTVLVEVGYNDDHDTFATDVERSITLLLSRGAKHILWVNLHGSSQQINDMNAVLVAAARRHPQVVLVDWNGYAADHWSWFQGDSVHLLPEGAMQMAVFLNDALVTVVHPLGVATVRPPAAHVGKQYSTRLRAQGGTAPYVWRIVGGALPKGLRLHADGHVDGKPLRKGRFGAAVQVTDAKGRTSTRLELVAVSAR